MWKLLLLCCVACPLVHANDKSSSICDTESHDSNAPSSDSGFSESGLSDSVPSARKTKRKVTPRRPPLRTSKFPLQFARQPKKSASQSSDEYESAASASESEGGKKVYKDVNFRKNKFKEALLKEQRKASTRNPNKKKKTTIKVKRVKPRRAYVFENVSDLNFADTTLMGDLAVTGKLGDGEIHIDKAKAGQLLEAMKEKLEKKRGKKFEDDSESDIEQRTDNPLFKASNESGSFGSRYDDLLDAADEKEEDHGKHNSERGEVKTTVTEDSEEDDEEDDEDYVMTTLTEAEKEERAYRVLSKLKNETGIHIPSAERADHKKIIMDTLRKQGLSHTDEEILDIVSHYDSITQKSKEEKATTKAPSTGSTTKRSILWSVEQAYKKAVREGRKNNGTRRHSSERDSKESKEYKPLEVDVGYTKHSSASREKRREEKKKRKQEKKSEREARKKGKAPPLSSKEARNATKERPILKREERPRRDSRERYGRDRYRDRPRYSRERYGRDRYDSRPRYGDRGRFSSRERYGRERDSRDRYRPRYEDRDRDRYRRRDSREDRGRRDYREGGRDYRERGRDYREDRGRYDRGRYDGRDDRRRDDREQDDRYVPRERMTRKKWYSEERVTPNRVFGDKPRDDVTRRMAKSEDRFMRNAGRSRINKVRPEQSSFEREYPKFANNDEENSVFQKFIKNKKLSDILDHTDTVTIP